MSTDQNYDELTLAKFAAGYASILQLKTLTPIEDSVTVILMYLPTKFAWPAIQEFRAAVLFEIECGHVCWGDSFNHLESRLLHLTPKLLGNSSAGPQSNAVLFWDSQSGKCMQGKDHYGMIRGSQGSQGAWPPKFNCGCLSCHGILTFAPQFC